MTVKYHNLNPRKFVKDPGAKLDYTFDWSQYLADGETIQSQTVTVPNGLTESLVSANDTAVTVWVEGGTADTDYDVVCQVTTSAGRIDERTIIIQVRNL